jgi:hypothetical protein
VVSMGLMRLMMRLSILESVMFWIFENMLEL